MEDQERLTPQTGAAEQCSGAEGQDQDRDREPVSADRRAPDDAVRDAALPIDLAGAYRKVVAEKQELYDRLLRKQAEVENFRKRVQNEKEEFLKHATADLIRSLLPALDAFDRALSHRDPKVPEQFYQGVELIRRELMEVLQRAGLVIVEAKGKQFDPHLHQAVETVEAAGFRDQEVVEELQRGYKLRHRLLRPAIVKVAVGEKTAGRESS